MMALKGIVNLIIDGMRMGRLCGWGKNLSGIDYLIPNQGRAVSQDPMGGLTATVDV
jgi:hypothetical protein